VHDASTWKSLKRDTLWQSQEKRNLTSWMSTARILTKTENMSLGRDSGANLPPIPEESYRPFRVKLTTHSGEKLPLF